MESGRYIGGTSAIKIPPICVSEQVELCDGSISAVFHLEGKGEELGGIVSVLDSAELHGELDGVLADGEEDGGIAGIGGFESLFECGVETVTGEFQRVRGSEDGGRSWELEGKVNGVDGEGAGVRGRYEDADAFGLEWSEVDG